MHLFPQKIARSIEYIKWEKGEQLILYQFNQIIKLTSLT